MKQIAGVTVQQAQKMTGVPMEVVADREVLADVFARTVMDHVKRANRARRRIVMIMPVGPTGQWRRMAEIAAGERIDLSRLCIVQMDEYLGGDSVPLPASDPFSFAGFIRRQFGLRACRECGFRESNWVAPDSADTGAVERAIHRWGGVDVAFAGIGLNGHMAFNEAPSPNDAWDDETFAASPTRVVKLVDVTKATNSIFGTGGELGRVPDYAVTIGMKQILGAREIHIFLDWQWQRFIWRRALLGPVTRFFPASYLQRHRCVRFTVTKEVAEAHRIEPE